MKAIHLTAVTALIIAAATAIFAGDDGTTGAPATAPTMAASRIVGLACIRTGLQNVTPDLAPATPADLKGNYNRVAGADRRENDMVGATKCEQMARLDADTADTIVLR